MLGKLLTPCKVAEQLMVEAEKRCSERQCTLESDLATVTLVQENMTSFQKDLFRDVAFERFQVRTNSQRKKLFTFGVSVPTLYFRWRCLKMLD